MGYRDNTMVPSRAVGRMRFPHHGIGAWQDPNATMTGTFLTTPTEAEAIAGTQTVIITISGAIWAAAGTLFDAQRQNIINGLDSNKSEVTGWNTLIRDVAAVTTVVRTSATVVTVTLPAAPLYKITANERIAFTVPQTAVQGGVGVASGNVAWTIVNDATVVTADTTGTAVAGGVTEAQIVTGGETIILTLTSGTWIVAGATAFDAKRQAIINGLTAAASPAAGWNIAIKAVMAVGAVVRTSNSIVTITTPATAGYSIATDETITITIPKEAIALADADVVSATTVVITAA